MKTVITLIVSAMLIASCDDAYPQPYPSSADGCAYPTPAFDDFEGKLGCNTGFPATPGSICYWPCANWEGVCGAEVIVTMIGQDVYETAASYSAAPWCP